MALGTFVNAGARTSHSSYTFRDKVTWVAGKVAGLMSGKIFDLTPETEGPHRPAQRSAPWEYGSSVGDIHVARKRALERAAEDALRDADWAVRRRAARGEEVWEREVRLAVALQAEGTAYLARKREERRARQAAEAAATGAPLTDAATGAGDVVQARAEVGREGGALSPPAVRAHSSEARGRAAAGGDGAPGHGGRLRGRLLPSARARRRGGRRAQPGRGRVSERPIPSSQASTPRRRGRAVTS